MSIEVLTTLCALLAGAVLAFVLLLRRAHRRADAALERQRDEAAAQFAAMDGEHRAAREVVEGQRDEAQRLREAARQALALGTKYEEASRAEILAACAAEGLHGVLATNVVFLPPEDMPGGRFVAQLDHVLLTEDAVTIIEGKRWRGVVFDGCKPSAAHPAFRGLFDEEELREDFAIQLTREDSEGGSLTVRRHLDRASPRAQVRRQAQRLHEHLKAQTGSAPWIEHAVFYSHPHATVHWANGGPQTKAARTAILAGTEGLRRWLAGRGAAPRSRVTAASIERYAALFHALGARVDRFGGGAAE